MQDIAYSSFLSRQHAFCFMKVNINAKKNNLCKSWLTRSSGTKTSDSWVSEGCGSCRKASQGLFFSGHMKRLIGHKTQKIKPYRQVVNMLRKVLILILV